MKTLAASVIIPTYNQASRLLITLNSLAYQKMDNDESFEVIVVDDGSSDDTANVLDQFKEILPLKTVYQENKGRASARNRGIMASSSEIILFCDSDRPVTNYWVQNHISHHRNNENFVVGVGDIREFFFSNLEERTAALIEAMKQNYTSYHRLSRPFGFWEFLKNTLNEDGKSELSSPWVMTLIGNLSLRKSLLENAGVFDEDFKGWGFEHFELGYRLHNAGATFWYVPDATNYHLAHGRPENFYKEQMQASYDLFRAKYPVPVVDRLLSLMSGEITLGEFHNLATYDNICSLPDQVQNLRFRPLLGAY